MATGRVVLKTCRAQLRNVCWDIVEAGALRMFLCHVGGMEPPFPSKPCPDRLYLSDKDGRRVILAPTTIMCKSSGLTRRFQASLTCATVNLPMALGRLRDSRWAGCDNR